MAHDPDPITREPREEDQEETDSSQPRRLTRLSLPIRVTVLALGWLLVLVGIAGLFLPGLQGILTILLGLAIASLGSDRIHRFLHDRMHPWPRARLRMETLRQRLHGWLDRRR